MDDWMSSNSNFYYAEPLHPLNTSAEHNENKTPKIPQTIRPHLINSPNSAGTGTAAVSQSSNIVHINEARNLKTNEDKRQLHLQSEKRRREKIQISYKYLESIVLPILGNVKLSRAELLRRTADLVQDMHSRLQK
eukprot:NODE_90_length_21806_cov_0.389137.p9 type:complete len:135 gc:universal NODE_90_length_21806_cov_0.389137:21334-20930(-)